MKIFKWGFVGITLFLAVLLVSNRKTNRKIFEPGKTGTFKINVGETVRFKLRENRTTGYQNCWINPAYCKNVALLGKTYGDSPQSDPGLVGGDGPPIIFTFKGIRQGIDTLAFANCPTDREGKDCSAYSIQFVRPDRSLIVIVQ